MSTLNAGIHLALDIGNKCGHTVFPVKGIKGFHIGDAGVDLPDKKCPECGKKMSKEGFDIPVETFMGFHFDREPDFDLNYAVEYQSTAQRYLGEIDGVGAILSCMA